MLRGVERRGALLRQTACTSHLIVSSEWHPQHTVLVARALPGYIDRQLDLFSGWSRVPGDSYMTSACWVQVIV